MYIFLLIAVLCISIVVTDPTAGNNGSAMTSLSSDVTNAVWYAYRHHERFKGCVPRNDLIVSSDRVMPWTTKYEI